MLKLHHEDSLKYYIKKYNIDNIFEKNLKSYMEIHCFYVNENIITKNSNPDYLYFLVEGKAIKLKNNLSQNIIKPSINNLNLIGHIELFTKNSFEYNLKSIDECIFIAIPIEPIKTILLNDNKFLKYCCNNFAKSIYNNNLDINFYSKEKDAI